MRKYGFKNIAFALRLIVSALNGCHKVNRIALPNVKMIIALSPLSFVLFGINIPRKNDSSRNEGNINKDKGNI